MSEAPELADLGLEEVAVETLHRSHAERLARTLDGPHGVRHRVDGSGVLSSGTLPLTWIWTFFTPMVATAGLRADGHPAGSGSGPLAGLDRRMFIGGSLQRYGDIRLDERTERHSRVVGSDAKQGSSGDFVIVDVEHRYDQSGAVVLVERQKLMYRTQPDKAVEPPGPPVQPEATGHHVEICPDERLLFRYSALTFNTHRIHYDLPYATGIEGYPGLVVHGPLTATLLADLAADRLSRSLSSFEFRATAPTFAGTPVHLTVDSTEADQTGQPLAVTATRSDGATVMTAQAG